MSVAVRIDLEAELAAIERGECGGCRVLATHKFSDVCSKTENFYKMTCCAVCDTMYYPPHLSGKYVGVGCPECFDRRAAA